MSEQDVIAADKLPVTADSLADQLQALGLRAGQVVLVHTRMSALGWVAGGAVAVIEALLRVLTPAGTLMMPTFTNGNTDPANWQNPPVPEAWWPVIRASMPAYDPRITPTRMMGQVAEVFRIWPGAIRSEHPMLSFAALGAQAEALIAAETPLAEGLGEQSPLGRLYALDGWVLLLGVDHQNNSSIHLAEYRARFTKPYIQTGCAMRVNGRREWVTMEMLDVNDNDFPLIGAAFEAAHPIQRGLVGNADARMLRQRPLVDFAVGWMEQHRG